MLTSKNKDKEGVVINEMLLRFENKHKSEDSVPTIIFDVWCVCSTLAK